MKQQTCFLMSRFQRKMKTDQKSASGLLTTLTLSPTDTDDQFI